MSKYYVVGDDNCKYEGMTKEEILAAIKHAVETGEIKDVDAGFITRIKEGNKQRELTFWVGTRAEYNLLTEQVADCLYIITDDEVNDLVQAVDEIKTMLTATDKSLDKTIDDIRRIDGEIGFISEQISGVDRALTTVENNVDSISKNLASAKGDIKLLQEIELELRNKTTVSKLNIRKTDLETVGKFALVDDNEPLVAKHFGNVVSLTGRLKKASKNVDDAIGTSNLVKVYTLPNYLRPTETIRVICEGAYIDQFVLSITTDGTISIGRYTRKGEYYEPTDATLYVHATWINE